ncbi:MAG: hypothetical protein Q9217_000454 [Psora testacea]
MANSIDGQNSIVSVVGPLSHIVASLKLVLKALLSQQPWLHNPLCHEIPWRDDQEEVVKNLLDSKEQLAFGIFRHDGQVTPHPPVRRAMDMISKAIENLGHKVIAWAPPLHKRGNDICAATWEYDGGLNICSAFALSGEPIAPQVVRAYGQGPREQANGTSIAANSVAKREYQKEYIEYWNGTVKLTGTGRPVDAIIMPVAPFAAARPERWRYYGYTAIVNTLDYTSCVIPVMSVDKNVDIVDQESKAVNELDKQIFEDCK